MCSCCFRPDTIDASGIYRDPVAANDTLVSDTTNMGNLPWKEVFKDAKLQALIEEGLQNNVDMQAAVLRVKEAKVMLTSARLSYLPSISGYYDYHWRWRYGKSLPVACSCKLGNRPFR